MSAHFLMIKRGLYYGPDNRDYTAFRSKAGRYTLAEVKDRHERSGGDTTYVHEDEAAEFSAAASPEAIIDYLLSERDHLRQQVADAIAPVPTDAEIAVTDQRMTAAGMVSLVDLLAGKLPTDRWAANVGVTNIKSFGDWLDSKNRQYATMRMGYELGDKVKDGMYDWIIARSGTYSEVIANFRKALGQMTEAANHE
jgi:hypothetical protein